MAEPAILTITDPVPTDAPARGLLARWCGPLIRDARDLPFVRLSLQLTLLLLPLAVCLFVPGLFRWWLAPIYWALYGWQLGPYVLMLHNTSHRTLFRRRYRLLNSYIPWVLGPLLGMSPETYYVHHIGMHHVDGNLPDDLSSTMPYQRDSFLHFLRYYLAFLFGYGAVCRYFWHRGRLKLLRRFWLGELSYVALATGLSLLDWRAAVVVFAVPLVVTRFMLMAGNWAQHGFVDPDEPANDYRTVTTFINSPYNHRCFNDGYHLGHHLKPNRHWLEMPTDFLAKREEMIRQGALVFRKLDYFAIFWLLMLKRYRTLARHLVHLGGSPRPSEAEQIALLHRRLRAFDPATLAPLRRPRPGPRAGRSTSRSSPAALQP